MLLCPCAANSRIRARCARPAGIDYARVHSRSTRSSPARNTNSSARDMSHCFQTTTRKSVTTRDTRGPPISEPYLLCGIAHEKLAAQVINIKRSYVGEYRTPTRHGRGLPDPREARR